MTKKFARQAAMTLLLSFVGCSNTTGGRSDGGDGGDGSVDGPRDPSSAGDARDASVACDPAACPQPTDECQAAFCGSDGQCGLRAKADGVATTQSAGDCKRKVCSGGTRVSETDDTDLPVDSNECTRDVCSAGVPSNPPLPQDQACGPSGAKFCDGAGACAECTAPTQCAGSDTECRTRTCIAGACGVSFAAQGTAVASQMMGDCKKNQCDGNGAVKTINDDNDPESDGNACTDNSCSSGNKVSTPTPINTTCGANLKCDGNGSCVGCTAVSDCAVPTNPCLVAICTAGTCGTAAKSDGTSCNDGNACSQTDSCQAGSCAGANPVTCAAAEQCHVAGVCNGATGVCSNPPKVDGSACSDGNACSQTDTCQAGTCTGASPVTCTALDQCHDAGTCDTATGICSNPNRANGAACNDGNTCTSGDTCTAGTCGGATPSAAIDQSQTSFNSGNAIYDGAQSFTPAISGRMTALTLYKNGLSGEQSITLEVRLGSGVGGAVLYTGVHVLPNTTNATTVTLSSVLNLTAGVVYTFRIVDPSQTLTSLGQRGNPYAGGAWVYDTAYGTYFINQGFDLWFQTTMVPGCP